MKWQSVKIENHSLDQIIQYNRNFIKELYYLSTNFFMFVINLYSIIYLWLKFFCKNIPCCRMLTNGLPLGQGKHFFKLLQSYSWINQVWCDFQFFLSDLRPWLWLYVFLIKFIYRVSHFEMDFMNWLWRMKICKLDLVWRWFWNAEIGNFWVQQLFFKKVTSAGLNSLRQEGYQISVKNCIFDNPFHEKGPVLVILVPGMI